MTMLPTFYIMTHEADELKGYTSKNIDELVARAFEWADSKEIGDSAVLVDQLMQKFELVSKVKPDVAEDTKKKDQALTDG